jgi:hypothetical protein
MYQNIGIGTCNMGIVYHGLRTAQMKRLGDGREGDESELCPRWPGVGGS